MSGALLGRSTPSSFQFAAGTREFAITLSKYQTSNSGTRWKYSALSRRASHCGQRSPAASGAVHPVMLMSQAA